MMRPFKLDYIAFPAELHGIVKGFTAEKDGKLYILIDRDLDEQTRLETLRHELAHICAGHFNDSRTDTAQSYLQNMDTIEREADKILDQLTDEDFSRMMQYAIKA